MKSKQKVAQAGRRERREFSEEFQAEAVRLAAGGSLTQLGRELDV